MARKSRPTFKKRQKEIARQQRARDKMARRLEKKERPPAPTLESNEDPDIAGIRPGPQPLPEEWSYLPNSPREPKEESSEGRESES